MLTKLQPEDFEILEDPYAVKNNNARPSIFETMQKDGWDFKIGRTSGLTAGRYHACGIAIDLPYKTEPWHYPDDEEANRSEQPYWEGMREGVPCAARVLIIPAQKRNFMEIVVESFFRNLETRGHG